MTKLEGALGMCARARALVFGTPLVCEKLRDVKPLVYLVCLASDASDNAQKKVHDKCLTYGKICVTLPLDGVTLGSITGKGEKLAVVGVTDQNLAQLVLNQLQMQS